MSNNRHNCRKHSVQYKAKVALAAIRDEETATELARARRFNQCSPERILYINHGLSKLRIKS